MIETPQHADHRRDRRRQAAAERNRTSRARILRGRRGRPAARGRGVHPAGVQHRRNRGARSATRRQPGSVFFAVGLTRMALRIPNAGAFYAYIGQAFGKMAGGGAAVLAMLAYSTIAIGEIAVVGAFAATPLDRVTGVDIPWWVWALVALAIVAFLGHAGSR